MAVYFLVVGSTPAASGLTEGVGGLSVDFGSVARQGYTQTIGDGTTLNIVVTHSLSTRDVEVVVYRNSSPYDSVEVDVERTSTSTVTLRFAVAPATNAYNVIVTPIRGI